MLGCIGLFGAAALLALNGPPLSLIDRWGLQVAQDGVSPALRPLLHFITTLGSFPVTFALAALLAGWLYRQWGSVAAWTWLGSVAGSALLLFALKLWIGRARPQAPGWLQADFSFPSGHALLAMLVYGGMLLMARPRLDRPLIRGFWLTGITLLVVGIGASRVLLGVHYVTDVIGGFALGAAWLTGTHLLLRRARSVSSATRSLH